VLGNALLESAQALDEAATGTVVVSRTGWCHVSDLYEGEETPLGNFKVLSLRPGSAATTPAQLVKPTPHHHIWPMLKMYCHEGARDLQDIAPFAADVRKLTVMFIRLELDLEKPSHDTVLMTHKACLVIQNATYHCKGTLRQFLQDDKGCLAICVMGMPPFSPHDNDPVRAVLAALEIAHKLPEQLGIGVYIGITSGTAYSGFVGSQTRREMCAMGSMVNMAARLMCKAGKNQIWVDEDTREACDLMVEFDTLQPVQVKGRDAPLNVFRGLQEHTSAVVRRRLLDLVRKKQEVDRLPPALENYLSGLLSKGVNGCTPAFIINVCNNLIENGHIHRQANGVIVSKQNLLGLDNGQTSMQALARGDFESLSLQIHVQMLLKVVCFLSHKALFSCSLAKFVYSKTFPSFAMDFDSAIMELLDIGVLEPARAEDIEQMISTVSSTCHECHSWTWQPAELQADLHAQQLLFYEGALSRLKDEAQPHDAATQHKAQQSSASHINSRPNLKRSKAAESDLLLSKGTPKPEITANEPRTPKT
jgi:hypothetical protein